MRFVHSDTFCEIWCTAQFRHCVMLENMMMCDHNRRSRSRTKLTNAMPWEQRMAFVDLASSFAPPNDCGCRPQILLMFDRGPQPALTDLIEQGEKCTQRCSSVSDDVSPRRGFSAAHSISPAPIYLGLSPAEIPISQTIKGPSP